MKKILIAMIIALLAVAAMATVAFADNGPHGGFSTTTSDCASCHRMHTAQSSDGFLLVEHDVYVSCISCHGDGVGAYTDVKNGVYAASVTGATWASPIGSQGDAGQPLFGGGFENVAFQNVYNGMLGYDVTSDFPSPSPATSTHSVEGLGAFDGSGTIWGSGLMDTNADASTDPATVLTGAAGSALECTSCHDPHGNAGWSGTAKTASYRLLRYTPIFSEGWSKLAGGATTTYTGVQVADTTNQYWYTINSDITLDPSVSYFSSRFSDGVWGAWSTYITAKGDPAGRYATYKRPAMIATTVTTGAKPSSITSCGMFDLSAAVKSDGTALLQGADVADTSFDYNSRIVSCGTPTGTTFDNQTARKTLSDWCSTCHDRYGASSARSTDSGDDHYSFRHTSTGTSNTSVGCTDCHAAHGTNAVMTNTNLEHPTAALTNGSILLKTDERSICLNCHASSINFNYVPTPSPIP